MLRKEGHMSSNKNSPMNSPYRNDNRGENSSEIRRETGGMDRSSIRRKIFNENINDHDVRDRRMPSK